MNRSRAFNLIAWIGAFTVALSLIGLISIYPSGPAIASPQDLKNQEDIENLDCSILDDAKTRGMMSGMFELKMLILCGRTSELGPGKPVAVAPLDHGQDKLVNDPNGDLQGTSKTQSETSLAVNENNGMLCSAYNDNYHFFADGIGFTGFSSSNDDGATWIDHGAVPKANGEISHGDPSLVWRKLDGHFYLATMITHGLALYDLGTNCTSASYVVTFHVGNYDDKELMAVDNSPTSPYYGRFYVAWTNIGNHHINSTFSDNKTTWSNALDISLKGWVGGAWPAVDPVSHDVYISWTYFNNWPLGTVDIEVVRSTNGGNTYAFLPDARSNVTIPSDPAALAYCERPALNGNIRNEPTSQIAVDSNGFLHIVYSYDPDGYNYGDVVNVYYRRSTDHGASWGPEIKVNTDTTNRDQFSPALTVNPAGFVAISWYDRRLSGNNLYFDYYEAISTDNGLTFQPNIRVSDSSSPVVLDPSLAKCYHGDYDTSFSNASNFYFQWSDDRGGTPDVYMDTVTIAPDFVLSANPDRLGVCKPDPGQFNQYTGSLWGFSSPVALSASGNPPGTTTLFSVNPVNPPANNLLTIGNTSAAAPGSYNIDILGLAQDLRHTVRVGFDLYGGIPGMPGLLSPADGAVNQSLAPILDWSDGSQAGSYNFTLANNPMLDNALIYEPNLPTSNYAITTPLAGNTCYWWSAQSNNTCGVGGWSQPFHFTTVLLGSRFSDGLESGPGNWLHSAAQGVDQWTLVTDLSHSPTHSWNQPNPSAVSDVRLWIYSPISVGLGSALTFWHRYQFEEPNYDGGVLEISTDSGANWEDLGSHITANGYNDTINSNYGNPLAGRPAFTGDLLNWVQVVVDLNSYAGHNVMIRWRLGSDNSLGDAGWYIDDVQITGPMPPSPLPTLTSIQPNTGDNRSRTEVTITGSGFFGTPALKLDGHWLGSVSVVNSTTIHAVVLPGLPLGVHDLVIYNGDCQNAVLLDAFNVTGIGKNYIPVVHR